MNDTTANPDELHPWSEETTGDSGIRRVRAHIGGMHCSLCTGTIERALGAKPGVQRVAVSLTHEQALVEYDDGQTDAATLMGTLHQIGYTLSDPRKVEPFERQEQALAIERNRFLAALTLSLAAVGLIVDTASVWTLGLSALVYVSLVGFGYAVLRGRATPARWPAARAAAGGLVLFALRASGVLAGTEPVLVAALALALVFGLARHMLVMAFQALRRGILNQHVLVEIGAFAGLIGGAIGLVAQPSGYPTAAFFAVSVMVLTYHLFSEWLSLIVDAQRAVGQAAAGSTAGDRARSHRRQRTGYVSRTGRGGHAGARAPRQRPGRRRSDRRRLGRRGADHR